MEQKLKERLLEESNHSDALKEEIWAALEQELDADSPLSRTATYTTKRRPSYMKMIKLTTGIAAAAIAVGIFLSLPVGTAFMKEVQTWFAPEKKVEVEVEGQKEETQQELHLDEESKYALYYDVERYKLIEEGDKAIITTKEPLPEQYPEVSLTIEQFPGGAPAAQIELAKEALAGQYAEIRDIDQVTEPVAGYRVSAIDGNQWDSNVVYIYAIDNGKGGSFVFTMKYFLEAAEGHGSRFSQMLKEFTVLD